MTEYVEIGPEAESPELDAHLDKLRTELRAERVIESVRAKPGELAAGRVNRIITKPRDPEVREYDQDPAAVRARADAAHEWLYGKGGDAS